MTATEFPTTEFAASLPSAFGGLVFTGLLVYAAISDVRARRIPNRVVIALAALGLLFSATTLAPIVGVERALLGFGIGFGLWVPFYALRMLGAGDVKLFAAAGCWLAPSQLFAAAVLSAVLGAVLSIVGLVLAHGFGVTTFRVVQAVRDPSALASPLAVPPGARTLPYGLAMAVGLALVGWFAPLFRM